MPKKKTKPTQPKEENPTCAYHIDLQTYSVQICLLWSNKLAVKDIVKKLCREEDINMSAQSNEAGDGAMTIMVPEKRLIYVITDKDTTVSMLHHEIIHTVMYIFYMIQTPHTDDTDEVFAYLSQSLFSNMYEVLLNKFKVSQKDFLSL